MQEPQKKRMELGGGEDHAKDIMDSNFMTDLKHQQQQETTHQQKKQLDSGAALQAFLDHIPINAIPGIQNSSSVMEVKAGESVEDAIEMLYKKNVSGAPIADFIDPDNMMSGRVSDRYMGFIDFARMLLWCFHKCDNKPLNNHTTNPLDSFFTMLHHNPDIAQTKVLTLCCLMNHCIPSCSEQVQIGFIVFINAPLQSEALRRSVTHVPRFRNGDLSIFYSSDTMSMNHKPLHPNNSSCWSSYWFLYYSLTLE
ncbi:SNF1-related protein kinase regulatory subunit gamma-1 [Linum grandiflorum]